MVVLALPVQFQAFVRATARNYPLPSSPLACLLSAHVYGAPLLYSLSALAVAHRVVTALVLVLPTVR
eukprot:3887491-Pleurochrysis_carterae.AAC.1